MKRMFSAAAALFTVLSCCAQAGAPDLSFGTNGIVRTGFGLNTDLTSSFGSQVLAAPDGSFYMLVSIGGFMTVVHHQQDGTFDTGYGVNGYGGELILGAGSPFRFVTAKALLQADGKIVFGASKYFGVHADYVVVRLNTSGFLDSSFAGDGIAEINFQGNSSDFLFGLALQPDGKIIAGGCSNTIDFDFDFSMARLNANGTLDNTFSGDGKLTTPIGSNSSIIFDIAVGNDGKIVAVGDARVDGPEVMAIARYLPDGTPDNSFSGDGIETITTTDRYEVNAVAVQPDNKILLAGASRAGNNSHFFVARLNAGGGLDNSFSGDGMQTAEFWLQSETAHDMLLQPDGKIVVAGQVFGYGGYFNDIGIARFNPDGTPDITFSGDGVEVTEVTTSNDAAYSVALGPGGKLLAGGLAAVGAGRYAVVRYNANGIPDNSLDGDGSITGYKPSSPTSYAASAVQPDGKIVAVGSTMARAWWTDVYEREMAVVRYNADGSLDNSFSGDGRVYVDYGTGISIATAVAIQPDGKIVVAGYASNGSNDDFALLRLNADGTPDNSFDNDGMLLTEFDASMDHAHAVVVQPDGKIVAGGFTADWRTNQAGNFAVARYNADGSLDNSFSGDGKAVYDFSPPDKILTEAINALVLQPDGKIVAVGNTAHVTSFIDFMVVRYNPDGTLDPTFNGTGMTTTPIGDIDQARSAVLQPDGKIVAGGYGGRYPGTFALVRYNTNGTLDSSFSGDGIEVADLSGEPNAVLLQSDGKIILGGFTRFGFDDIVLLRYNADGTPDNSFSGDGRLIMSFGAGERLFSLSQFGNRLYVVGASAYEGGTGFVAALQLDVYEMITLR